MVMTGCHALLQFIGVGASINDSLIESGDYHMTLIEISPPQMQTCIHTTPSPRLIHTHTSTIHTQLHHTHAHTPSLPHPYPHMHPHTHTSATPTDPKWCAVFPKAHVPLDVAEIFALCLDCVVCHSFAFSSPERGWFP